MNIFGPKQVRVEATAEQEENRVCRESREGEVEQGNETLNRQWQLMETQSEKKYQEKNQ